MNEGGEGNCQINLEEEPPSPGDKNLPVPTNSLTNDTSDATSSLAVLPSSPAALLEISNQPPVKIRGFGAVIAPPRKDKPAVDTTGHTPVNNAVVNRVKGFAAAPRRAQSNPKTKAFRKKFFPDVTDRDWNDWRWQSRHRIRTLDQFEKMLRALRRRARRRSSQGGIDAAGRHHAVLHEPARPRTMPMQPLRRTVVPVDERVRPHRRRSRRSAGRRWPQPGAGPGASLSRPRAAAAARLLLDLLPLLHALARRRSRRDHAEREAAGEGVRLPSQHAAGSRRADLRRRSAGAERRQARLDSRQPAGDSAHRVRPHRHQDAGRAAAADHAAADAACCGSIIRCG